MAKERNPSNRVGVPIPPPGFSHWSEEWHNRAPPWYVPCKLGIHELPVIHRLLRLPYFRRNSLGSVSALEFFPVLPSPFPSEAHRSSILLI